jgi:hypothetical protein
MPINVSLVRISITHFSHNRHGCTSLEAGFNFTKHKGDKTCDCIDIYNILKIQNEKFNYIKFWCDLNVIIRIECIFCSFIGVSSVHAFTRRSDGQQYQQCHQNEELHLTSNHSTQKNVLVQIYINVREYQRRSRKWTIQRNWQHRVLLTKTTES